MRRRTRKPRPKPDPCPGCGHALAVHYRAGDGTMRCLIVTSAESQRGVIGLRSDLRCDCCNGRSERAERKAKAEREQTNRIVTAMEDAMTRAKNVRRELPRPGPFIPPRRRRP